MWFSYFAIYPSQSLSLYSFLCCFLFMIMICCISISHLGLSAPPLLYRASVLPPAGVVGSRYRYTTDLLELGAHRFAGSSPQWAMAPTPIAVSHLASLLCHHPDKVFVSVILRGLNEGFPIGFDSAHCSLRSVARNHPSSLCHSNIVTQYIAHEVSLGRLVGPVSPLGVHTSPM